MSRHCVARIVPHTVAALLLGGSVPAHLMAAEGMWRPDQLPSLAADLASRGLALPAEQLADLTQWPMSAVISLGGCTASFVSPQGLVVTNHHCAYGSIQYNSNEEHNYLRDGFLAADMRGELPGAPGTRVYVTTQIETVTETVLAGLTEDTPPRDRYQAVEDRQKALIAECEAPGGLRCQVASFNGGEEYRLITRLEIRDVRLVYAPPQSIGTFGGDIDNWMWPRHTGDWSFYRAYVGPDGAPADFSEDNVPYEPDSFLNVSSAGLEEGDFVMAAGYPGSTERYARLTEVNGAFDWSYPLRKRVYEGWADTIVEAAAENPDAQIKYASLLASINNATKNYGGQLEGAQKVGLKDRRAERDAELNAWVAATPERTAKYADAIAAIDAEIAAAQSTRERDFWYGQITRPTLLSTAQRLYRLAQERQKPDAEREPGFQERDMTMFRQGLQQIDRRFDPDVDLAAWMYFLNEYRSLSRDQRTAPYDRALGLSPDESAADLTRRLADWYERSTLTDTQARLNWMNASPAAFEGSNDPFIAMAVALYETDMAQEERLKNRAGKMLALQPRYMEAITAWQASLGRPVYPDANSTLRVTYGEVKPACPRDGLCYTAFTTLEGIVEKYTGEDPFDAPARQRELIEQGHYGEYALDSIGSVPVNFLTTLDSTGGNSGSATLDSDGNLVGLLFDGTYESINSDWDFAEDITRTIHVDTRYMLWVMDYVDEADWLIEEMTLVQ